MSFKSVVAENAVVRTAVVITVVVAALIASLRNEVFIRAQSLQITGRSNLHLPDETAGLDKIARTLVSAFDQVDIVALGEAHGRKLDSDLRIAVVRQPDFAKKVRSIVVEFGSTTEQSTLDRYIRGENVSRSELEKVWKTTTQAASGLWDSPLYADFFAAVRDVNSKLPADAQIRVFGGDPGPGDNRSRETAAVSVLKEQVLQKHGKALVIYGTSHFFRTLGENKPLGMGDGPTTNKTIKPKRELNGADLPTQGDSAATKTTLKPKMEIGAAGLSTQGDDFGIVRTLEIDYPGRTFVVIPLGGRLDLDLPPGISWTAPDYQKFDRALKTKVRPVLVSLQRLPFRDFTAEEFVVPLIIFGPGGMSNAFKGSALTLGQIADACVYLGAGNDSALR